MFTSTFSIRSLRLGCALAVVAIPLGAAAQTVRSVRPATPIPAPAAITPGATAGAGGPSPTGLSSPVPNPAGLNSQFPAGLPDPTLPAPAATPTANTPLPTDAGAVIPATTMGAAGYGGVPASRRVAGTPPYTPVQIAQSFIGADANRDGQLTPVEAQRLTIMPSSFEEMDLNHDGVLTRSEYEDSLR